MLKLLPPNTKQKTVINLDGPTGFPVVLLVYAKALAEALDIDVDFPENSLSLGANAQIVREINKKLSKYIDLVTTDRKLIAECS